MEISKPPPPKNPGKLARVGFCLWAVLTDALVNHHFFEISEILKIPKKDPKMTFKQHRTPLKVKKGPKKTRK